MMVESWHSSHQADQKRFNLALIECFKQAGQPIDFDSFKDAMFDLAEELYPDMDEDYLEKVINGYAGNAEVISTYLDDTGFFGK